MNADDRDDELNKRIFPDSLRKVITTGLSAVFMTEEGIRNMLGDLRLPKEAIAYLVQQTDKSRRELFRIVAAELKDFLKSADVPGELRRAMNGLKVEVKAEIRFVDEGDAKTSVTARVAHGDGGGNEPHQEDSTPDEVARAKTAQHHRERQT